MCSRKSKYLNFCLLCGLLLPLLVHSETYREKMDLAVDSGQLDRQTALVYQVVATYDPSSLPAEFQTTNAEREKSGFALRVKLLEVMDNLTQEQKELLAPYVMRPRSLLPEFLVSSSGLFKIHYTNSGYNAVPQEDLDNSGIPDYVELAASVFDSVYQVEVMQFGLKAPLSDNNEDGPEWDVYLRQMSQYGETVPETKVSSNPDIWIGYMQLDNDYDKSFYTQGDDGLRVTAAHEFLHMIHLAYNLRSGGFNRYTDLFLMEFASTWAEDALYDYINDYYQYLGAPYGNFEKGLFNRMDLSFDTWDGWHEYGMSIWFHFLEKRFEKQLEKGEIIRRVWEKIVDYPALEAMDYVLHELGSSFQDELVTFYAWNYRTGGRADTVHFYPEGDAYPEIVPDGHYHFNYDTTLNEEVVPTAARYYVFNQDNGDSFALIPTNIEWFNPDSLNTITIAVLHGDQKEKYTSVSDGVLARLVTEDGFNCGAFHQSGDALFYLRSITASSLTDQDQLPACYPNPFLVHQHAEVIMPFNIDEPDLVSFAVFTSNGYQVYKDEQFFASGLQKFRWQGKNEQGNSVASGMYLFVIWNEDRIIRREKFAVVR